MKSLLSLFWLVCAVGCHPERTRPQFDDPGHGPPGGANGSAGGSGATSGGSTGSSGATGSGGAGGASSVADCHCIYELFHVPTCETCKGAADIGVCAGFLTACLNDLDCETNLTIVCPTAKDAPTAVAACLKTGSLAGTNLLAEYFACMCENPGPCDVDCNAAQQCGGGSGTTTSSASAASTGTGN